MKVIAAASIGLFLCVACGNANDQEVTPPSGLLNRKQFTEVLVDYALAESVSNLNLKSVTPAQFDTVYAFNPLKARNIRKTQFDSTVLFYSAHPRAYRQVYDTVLSQLNTLRLAREKSKNQDSLK